MSKRKLLIAKFALVFAVVPLAIHAYKSGPPPFVTGDPQDPGGATCNQSGCHVGTAVNGGGGNVQIILPGGATYVPGQTQQITVTISDSAQHAFGFELTARVLADNSQAGDLTSPAGSGTFVQCADTTIKTMTTTCPAGFNVQFVEHTAPKIGAGSATFTFQWTPPVTSAGPVTFYAAGNAANGTGDETGDHIYTTSVQLTPAATSSPPTVSNVLNAATGQSTIAANTYVAIYGQNLSAGQGRVWTAADFTANSNNTLNMPASLDGTSVTVGGNPAWVEYVSPAQINIITPDTPATGNGVPVIVSVNGQASAAFQVTLQNLAPSFFAWSPGTADFGKYLIAQHADYSRVGKPGLFPGTSPDFTTPAKPGETIQLYGTGFGPTSPPIAPGIQTDKTYNLNPTPTATLGSLTAPVGFAGLITGLSQVYQLNVTIPAATPDGDWPLVVNVNGTPSYPGLITVQH